MSDKAEAKEAAKPAQPSAGPRGAAIEARLKAKK
jgi:hypothetical protein